MKLNLARAYDKIGATVIIIAIVIVAVLFALYYPPPIYPKCAPNEIRVQSENDWWCVPARKP